MRVSTCFLFFFFFKFFKFLQVVIFKIPYPGWISVGTFALIEAFEMATEMPVFDVTVNGWGKVALVKFFSDTVAQLAIFRITRRIFPKFPGLDGFTGIRTPQS